MRALLTWRRDRILRAGVTPQFLDLPAGLGEGLEAVREIGAFAVLVADGGEGEGTHCAPALLRAAGSSRTSCSA